MGVSHFWWCQSLGQFCPFDFYFFIFDRLLLIKIRRTKKKKRNTVGEGKGLCDGGCVEGYIWYNGLVCGSKIGVVVDYSCGVVVDMLTDAICLHIAWFAFSCEFPVFHVLQERSAPSSE